MPFYVLKERMTAIDERSNSARPERAFLIGLSADSMEPDERSTEATMEELRALLETAGGEFGGIALQNRRSPDPRTFIGGGKALEIKEAMAAGGCTLAVFDNELSPSQARELEEELGARVLDRSGLILDIFADRARTREGRLQVELAQYRYLLPRLTGMWSHLVRQTASGASRIGTRGPGETQLETDRRHIRRKIQKLEEELSEVRRVRAVQRRQREKNAVPTVALVGYTNAGKSTLANALTAAELHTADRLFDTLDTATRRLELDETTTVLLSDTVGFIRKLPTQLVEAFKATLEELRFADLLLHVIDASEPDWAERAAVTDRLIEELGAESTPRLEVFNKCDLAAGETPRGSGAARVSALTGEGLDELKRRMLEALGRGTKKVDIRLPYDRGGLLDALHRECRVLSVDYTEAGIEVALVCGPETYGRIREYVL